MHRASTSRLTLIEISRWALAPQRGLEELLSAGRVEVDALRVLNSLADLVYELCLGAVPDDLSISAVHTLTDKISAGVAVDEDDVHAAQAWLKSAVALLRRTTHAQYKAALGRIIAAAEADALDSSS